MNACETGSWNWNVFWLQQHMVMSLSLLTGNTLSAQVVTWATRNQSSCCLLPGMGIVEQVVFLWKRPGISGLKAAVATFPSTKVSL
jgi:hypothetical protein